MRFEYPSLLWLLLLAVPGLTVFFWWAWRKKRQLISQFVQSRLLANLTVGVSAQRQKMRLGLIVAAVGLLIIVLARPQWGFDWEEARQRGLDIVIAIDTSRSMLAEDVSPNRLQRAKLAALDLKRLAKTDRIGLVAFAGSAFLQCPLSFDDEAFRQSVNALDVNIIPQGGTALAEAIQTAQAAFREKNDNHKILVLFTDGEDHDGHAVEVAKSAAKEGMRIFTIGVGSANGELLRITDARGRSDFIKDSQGNVVKSRLDENLLRQIAQSADGFYMLLSGANTMDLLYERGLAPLPKAEFSARRIQRFHERYQWLLGLAMLLLLLEMFLPERKPIKRTEAMVNAPNAELRKAATLLLMLALPSVTFGSPAKALQQYDKGKYESSLREYQKSLRDKPTDPRLHFNAAAAAYQAKDYDKALQHLNNSLVTEDLQLQQRAYYNLGNTQYRQGEDTREPDKKQEIWQDTVHSYESALKLNPKDSDAQYNLEVVKQRLEELKKQQQQQSKDDKNKDDKKDQSKEEQKDQSKKGDQSKDDKKQSKPDQEQKDKKPEDQQDAKKPDPAKEDQKQSESKQNQNSSQNKPDKSEEQGQQAQRVSMVKMTPEQARQLLDAQKNEEKAMVFIPPTRTNRTDRVFKDW